MVKIMILKIRYRIVEYKVERRLNKIEKLKSKNAQDYDKSRDIREQMKEEIKLLY